MVTRAGVSRALSVLVAAQAAVLVVYQLLQPLYRIAHKILPPMGGLDFTPMLLMLGTKLLEILLVTPLAQGLRVPANVVRGL